MLILSLVEKGCWILCYSLCQLITIQKVKSCVFTLAWLFGEMWHATVRGISSFCKGDSSESIE